MILEITLNDKPPNEGKASLGGSRKTIISFERLTYFRSHLLTLAYEFTTRGNILTTSYSGVAYLGYQRDDYVYNT